MRHIKRKISLILTLCMVFTLVSAFPAMALQKIDIVPAQYAAGEHSGILSNGTGVSLWAGKWLSYDINVSETPSSIVINIGSSKNYNGTLEVILDDKVSLGTITTDNVSWERKDYVLPITHEFRGKHKLTVKNTGKSSVFDFQGLTIVVNESSDKYSTFADTDVYGDIADNENRDKINLLYDLGIYKEADAFGADKLVTRRDFLRAVAGFYSDDFGSDAQAFKDIPKSDEDFKKFNMLCEQGIISADSKGNLNAHEFISLTNALRVLLKVMDLDYTLTDDSDVTVIKAARRADLISAGDSSFKSFNRNKLTDILYNAVTNDYMNVSGIYNDNYLYDKTERSVLEKTRGLKCAEGIVSANGFSDIYSVNDTAGFGMVKIDNDVYTDKTADGTAGGYLGFNCIYFYDEGTNNIVAIRPADDTEYTRLASKDITLTKFASDEVKYEDEKGKEYKLKTNKNTSYVFNGKAIDDDLSKYIDTSKFRGSLLMIDNDGDNSYDVVIIESYQSVIFGGMSEKAIYDKLTDTEITIDNKDDVLIYKDGVRQTLSDVEADSVIDLYVSKNKSGDKIVRGVICSLQPEGTVEYLRNGKTALGGIEYEKYHAFNKEIKVGQILKLMLNSDGEIVDYKVAAELKIGYLTGITNNNDSGLGENEFKIKMINEESSAAVYTFNKRCTADGETITSVKDAYYGKNSFKGMKNIQLNTPIRYGLNSEGKIIFIDTVETGTGDVNDCLTELAAEGTYYRYGNRLIQGSGGTIKCIFASDMKVINLWKDNDKEHGTITDTLSASEDVSFTCAAYSSSPDSMLADIAIWSSRQSGYTSKYVYSHRIDKLIKEEKGLALSCSTGSADVEFNVNKYMYDNDANFKKTIDSLKTGDIIQFRKDDNDEIIEVVVWFLHDGAAQNSDGISARTYLTNQGGSWLGNAGNTFIGTVEEKDDKYLKTFRTVSGNKNYEFFDASSVAVAVVEKDGGELKIKNGYNVNDIVKGQTLVLCKKSNHNADLIVIYSDINFE